MRPWLGAVLVLVAAAIASAAVRYEHDRVSASFDGVPAAEAVQAVAHATGAEVRGSVAATQEVRVELDAVPLEEALHRLLGGQSFTVRYGETGPKAIVLGSLADSPKAASQRTTSPAASTAAGVTPTETAKGFPINLSKIFDRHRALHVPDALAEKFGKDEMSMPQLLDIATADDDGLTRSRASQVVLSALEKESRYRRSFLRSLLHLEPDEVETIVGGPSGPEFEGLIEFFAAHSREPSMQRKAGIIYDQLRAVRILSAAGG